MTIDEEQFTRNLAELVRIGVEAERDRCARLIGHWPLARFKDGRLARAEMVVAIRAGKERADHAQDDKQDATP